MELGLKGKVALVTASSRGMGGAIAFGFAEEGARVTICARGEEALQAKSREIRDATGAEVLAVRVDVSKPEDVKNLVKKTIDRFGGVDILVTNVGGPPRGTFLELSDEDWKQGVDSLLMSVVWLCHGVIPSMKKRGGGRIINLTSTTVKEPAEDLVLSNALRLAVVGLAKTLSRELAKDNILVNNICPGPFVTARLEKITKQRATKLGATYEEVIRGFEKQVPLGRFGDPREIADLTVFLASERSSFISGASIQVDGGKIKALF